MKKTLSLMLLPIAAMLTGCAAQTPYQASAQGPKATISFNNKITLGSYSSGIYQNAQNCKGLLVIRKASKGPVTINANQLTTVLVAPENAFDKVPAHLLFSFYPKSNMNYRITIDDKPSLFDSKYSIQLLKNVAKVGQPATWKNSSVFPRQLTSPKSSTEHCVGFVSAATIKQLKR